jgi:anti-anti-sigma factor
MRIIVEARLLLPTYGPVSGQVSRRIVWRKNPTTRRRAAQEGREESMLTPSDQPASKIRRFAPVSRLNGAGCVVTAADTSREDVILLSVTGEIDLASRDSLRDTVLSYRDCAHTLVLDLTNAAFLSSAGLTMLIELGETIRQDVRLRLVTGDHAVVRVLGLDYVAGILPVFPRVRDALAEP